MFITQTNFKHHNQLDKLYEEPYKVLTDSEVNYKLEFKKYPHKFDGDLLLQLSEHFHNLKNNHSIKPVETECAQLHIAILYYPILGSCHLCSDWMDSVNKDR